MISGPIKIGEHRDAPTSWPVVDGSIYPELIPHSQLHMGLLIALAAMILLFIVMRYTTLGHRVRIVGQNPVLPATLASAQTRCSYSRSSSAAHWPDWLGPPRYWATKLT